MKKINFYKVQASGNDFVLIENEKCKMKNAKLKEFAKKYCQRQMGIGADGLLVIEPSKRTDFKMRIFNPDGSEAEMCGNGARCTALWANKKKVSFETKAGIIKAQLNKSPSVVKIKLPNPSKLKFDLPLKVLGRKIKINYINTGVPHVVIFVESLEKIDVENIGRSLRFHKKFKPAGTNVNFVEVLKDNFIKIRTYERGVEKETLACGTGAVASAILASFKCQVSGVKQKMKALTKSGEILKVYFNRVGSKIENVWLEGKAQLVYQGQLSL